MKNVSWCQLFKHTGSPNSYWTILEAYFSILSIIFWCCKYVFLYSRHGHFMIYYHHFLLKLGTFLQIMLYLSKIPTYNSHFNSHFLLSRSGSSPKKNSHFYLLASSHTMTKKSLSTHPAPPISFFEMGLEK